MPIITKKRRALPAPFPVTDLTCQQITALLVDYVAEDMAVPTRTVFDRQGRQVPSHVRVEPTAENGLTASSFIKCEQVLIISKARLETRLGRLSPDDLARVASALRVVLAL
jgi:mRNA-degrading endonuclease toxin of MazEF toxin-antitoxin module